MYEMPEKTGRRTKHPLRWHTLSKRKRRHSTTFGWQTETTFRSRRGFTPDHYFRAETTFLLRQVNIAHYQLLATRSHIAANWDLVPLEVSHRIGLSLPVRDYVPFKTSSYSGHQFRIMVKISKREKERNSRAHVYLHSYVTYVFSLLHHTYIHCNSLT